MSQGLSSGVVAEKGLRPPPASEIGVSQRAWLVNGLCGLSGRRRLLLGEEPRARTAQRGRARIARWCHANPSAAVKFDQARPYKCPLTGDDLVSSYHTLDELRTVQDFDISLALES